MVLGSLGQDPVILPPGIEPRYPWYRRLSGPQVWPGRVDERKVSFPHHGSNPGVSILQRVAVLLPASGKLFG
jgi:hypothetical protein